MSKQSSTPTSVTEKAAGLRVTDVSAGYGDVDVLHGCTIEVGAGEAVALVGPNGAGKSTLLKRLAGLIADSAGRIEWQGEDVTRSNPRQVARNGLRYVPEDRRVFGQLTVWENLEVAAAGIGIQRSQRQAEIQRAASYFPILEARRSQRAGLLSGGQQQMLAIARAILGTPKLLLLDEVSMGLAPIVVHEVGEALKTFVADNGVGVLLAEQNTGLAFDVCSRGYVMALGEIRMAGSADELGAKALAEQYLG